MADDVFSPLQERALIALAFDNPDFFSHIITRLRPDYFADDACIFMFHVIEKFYERQASLPTRTMARDIAAQYISIDDPLAEEIMGVCAHEIHPRDMEAIRSEIIKWIRNKAYGSLYSDEGIEAFQQQNYEKLHNIVEAASGIQDVGTGGFWLFEDPNRIFIQNEQTKFTTGFPQLDLMINRGGPFKGEVFVWMAPTGHGKSIAIVNTCARSFHMGFNVLHITMEMSEDRTAQRYVSTFSGHAPYEYKEHKGTVKECLRKLNASSDANLGIYEFAPDDISIDTIIALIDHLQKTKKFSPDVIAIDYMELLLSRNTYLNRDDYVRQKHVATELCQLAKKTGCFIVSATQTNRGDPKNADGDSILGLNRMAESYGKAMPVDYVVSINQARSEYKEEELSHLKFYIAKNRNGPKFKTVELTIDYRTMTMKEIESKGGNNGQAENQKQKQKQKKQKELKEI